MSGGDYVATLKKTHTKLKHDALNFWEVLAQAIALISPSMTAALIVPLMFGTAGTAGWLCYLFGTIMLLFVALNLNQFAKRYTSAGSMYEYTVKGLGPRLGGVSGWCLIWAYKFIGIAGVTGFTHFASKLAGPRRARRAISPTLPSPSLRSASSSPGSWRTKTSPSRPCSC